MSDELETAWQRIVELEEQMLTLRSRLITETPETMWVVVVEAGVETEVLGPFASITDAESVMVRIHDEYEETNDRYVWCQNVEDPHEAYPFLQFESNRSKLRLVKDDE